MGPENETKMSAYMMIDGEPVALGEENLYAEIALPDCEESPDHVGTAEGLGYAVEMQMELPEGLKQAFRAMGIDAAALAQVMRAVAQVIQAVERALVLAAEEVEAASGSVVSGLKETLEELEKVGAFDTEPRARRKRRERDRDRRIRQAYRAEIRRCERERFVRRIWKPPRKSETPRQRGRTGINGPRTPRRTTPPKI